VRRPVSRLLLAAVLTALLGAVGPACPSRDLEVQITNQGADTLVLACESFRDACAPAACHKNHFLCDQISCQLRDACELVGNPTWSPEQSMGMMLLLLQTSPAVVTVANASPCVPLNLRPCIFDPLGKVGCDAPVTDTTACITAQISTAVTSALGSGFTFSGFTNTEDVSLVAAFYHKPGNEASCDPSVLVNPNDCATANLMAVAGLGQTSGGTTYDITCASCQGGPHGSTGQNNEPCPVSTDACFLARVQAALLAAGY
jgi:hypothetical protein